MVIHAHARITGILAEFNRWAGIDLNGSSRSTVRDGRAVHNAGSGIMLSDDAGASAHDTVSHNIAEDNPGCGISLISHAGTGVRDNAISDNVADDNGTNPAAPATGSGSRTTTPLNKRLRSMTASDAPPPAVTARA